MLNALVLLLTLPALLMPPGMCVCRLTPVSQTHAPVPSPTPGGPLELAHAANPRPDCSCESCRSRSEPSDDPQSPTPEPCGPAEHAPGCPAAAGAAPLSLVVPAVTVTVDLTAFELTPLLLEPVAPPTRVRSAPSLAALRPLFLSHCALLI